MQCSAKKERIAGLGNKIKIQISHTMYFDQHALKVQYTAESPLSDHPICTRKKQSLITFSVLPLKISQTK